MTELKSAGGDCETEMKSAIDDASDYDLQVESASRSTATPPPRRSARAKGGPVATFTFVKENGGWRASALG